MRHLTKLPAFENHSSGCIRPESCPWTFGRQLNYQPFFKDINELFEFHKEKKPLFDARIKTALVQDQCWPIVVCLLGKIRMVILHVFIPTNKLSPDPFYFIASKVKQKLRLWSRILFCIDAKIILRMNKWNTWPTKPRARLSPQWSRHIKVHWLFGAKLSQRNLEKSLWQSHW